MTDSASTPRPAEAPALAALRERLQRLEGYVRQDPYNQSLLIDAFETALRCGEWGRAEVHLRHGQALQSEPLAWALREGDFRLAQHQYAQARDVLEKLSNRPGAPAGFADVVLHNLAYINLRSGNYLACVQQLAPRMESAAPANIVEGQIGEQPIEPAGLAESALQQLWLRALHHVGELERACSWAREAEQMQRLDPQAAGVASLIALDAAQMELAQRWAAWALSQSALSGPSMEALVTQGSLALGLRDAPRARQLADAALQLNAGDGRAWSVRAFADLLAGDLAQASAHFARALQTMPQHIGTWHGQGWTQLLQKNLAAAQLSFERALALDRNFAESHGALAVILALQRRTQAASEHIELALRLDSSNLSGRYAQALLKGEVQDTNSLQRLAKRLLGQRAGPMGGTMADWLPKDMDAGDLNRSGGDDDRTR